MAVVSVGQITIIDLFDAPSLSAWVSASQATTQTYNNTLQTWTPNYPTTAQVLTLNLTKAGSPTSIIGADVANIQWFKTVNGVKSEVISILSADNEYKSGTKNSVLTTKVNVPIEYNSTIYSATGVWTDPNTSLPVSFAAEIPLAVIQLAKAAVIGNIYAPNGDIFRNDMPASLTINTDLYKDGAISTTSRKIKWFAADSSVSTSQDADGGVGWRKVTATTGTTGEVANAAFDAAVTVQAVLTVYPNAVASAQTYKCVITDNAGGTSGQKVTNFLTVKDLDDPILVVIDSSGGDVLKNGVGTTTLNARLFKNGAEIDLGASLYTYKWSRWQNNTMDATWGTSGIKTGKTLSVGSADVDTKTMFKCEVNG